MKKFNFILICLSLFISAFSVAKQAEPKFYSKITERFYRQNQQQGKGTGLGLTLVNNIVKYHQGTINFEKSLLGGLQVNVVLKKALPPLINKQ